MEIQKKIKKCFELDKVLYTKHALQEMEKEKFGKIYDKEIEEIIIKGEIIEKYLDDKPYPSLLIYGRSKNKRPFHIVVSYNFDDDIAIIITAYHPNPELWINYERRKK